MVRIEIVKDKTAKGAEKDLYAPVTDKLNILEMQGNLIYWRDNHSRWNKPGFPDFFCLIKGKSGKLYTLFIELKHPKGHRGLTPEQLVWPGLIGDNEFIHYFATNSVDLALNYVYTLLDA